MKRNVLVIAGLAVLSTSAFASKARMEALGQGTKSYYINDTRSVFLNPSVLNSNKNYVVTEWGTAASTDSQTAPRAEGGFFREMGSFAYGLYLGNNDSRFAAHSVNGTYLDQDNGIDFFLAGDVGTKWGTRIHFASAKDETGTTAKKHSALGVGFGVAHGDLSTSLNVDISDKSTGTGAASEGGYSNKLKPSYTFDVSYAWMGNTFFASYVANKLENSEATTTTQKYSDMVFGIARTMELNPTSRVFADATVHLEKATNFYTSYTSIVATNTTKYNRMPVTIGLETEATSWLMLRGSVSQHVLLNQYKNNAGKKISKQNSTTVNGGATLNFGKLKVDGVVGTTGASRATGNLGTKSGVLTTDNLMARVGVLYNF